MLPLHQINFRHVRGKKKTLKQSMKIGTFLLDALASLKTMFKINSVTDVFKITRFQEYHRVLQSITECYRVLQSVTECYRVLQSVTECYRVL